MIDEAAVGDSYEFDMQWLRRVEPLGMLLTSQALRRFMSQRKAAQGETTRFIVNGHGAGSAISVGRRGNRAPARAR